MWVARLGPEALQAAEKQSKTACPPWFVAGTHNCQKNLFLLFFVFNRQKTGHFADYVDQLGICRDNNLSVIY